MGRQRKVSTSRVIAADRQRLFDIVADPSMHPVIDGSGSVKGTTDEEPERLAMGMSFGMDMRIGAPYRITNTVVEFEEGVRLAWRHMGGHRWRYEFADTPEGTLVTETFDWATSRSPLFLQLAGYPRRNLRGMQATLARLEELATTGEVSERS